MTPSRWRYRALSLSLLAALGSPVIVHAAPGDSLGPEFRVNTHTTGVQVGPSIVADDDGDFVIAWSSLGQDGSGYGIYAQRYATNGTPQGAEFRVNTFTTNSQVNASVAMDADGDFVIAWNSSG